MKENIQIDAQEGDRTVLWRKTLLFLEQGKLGVWHF